MTTITRTEAIEQIQEVLGGFVCYKRSMKNWLIPENEPLTEDDKNEIIQKVTEKTAGSHMVITFE